MFQLLRWVITVVGVAGVWPSPANAQPSSQHHRALGWISGNYSIGRDAVTSTFRLSLVGGYLKAQAPIPDSDATPSRQAWRVFRAHESDDRNMLQHAVEGTCLDAWTHKWMATPLVHAFECAADETHQHWIISPSAIGHTWIQPHFLSEWCLTVAPPNATTSYFADPTLERCVKGRQDQLFYFYP